MVGAFRTTLDELREADLLLHVVDVSAADIDVQITAVEAILEELKLMVIPRVLVFNKCDQALPQQVDWLCRRYGAIGISAFQPASLRPLLTQLELHVNALLPANDQTAQALQGDDEVALATYQ